MQKRRLKRVFLGSTLALGFSLAAWQTIEACTRVVYIGTDGIVITGRSMDWVEDMSSNLWAFPRGIKRDGAAGPNSLSWVAKYGSVVVSGYESATADGMNEAGLVANLLYLAESDYGKPDPARPVISISTWAQYALDNFATVAEAVDALAKEAVRRHRTETAQRRSGPAAFVVVGFQRRLGDLRVPRGQADHSSRQAIYRDDQLAAVRRATARSIAIGRTSAATFSCPGQAVPPIASRAPRF